MVKSNAPLTVISLHRHMGGDLGRVSLRERLGELFTNLDELSDLVKDTLLDRDIKEVCLRACMQCSGYPF